MLGTQGHDYPQFEDEDKQEAARFLGSDFDRYDEIIRGIDDLDRLNAWTEVAKELDCTEARRELRLRRKALKRDDVEEPVQFERASETDAGAAAVADGGAVVDEDSNDSEAEELSDSDSGDEQSVMEYDDPADRESKYEDAMSVARTYTEPDEVREKLQEEWSRDERRPHVVDALEDRLSEVTA